MRLVHTRFHPVPLALAVALALAAPAIAQAQAADGAKAVTLSIAAQPLGSALNELSAATGTPIGFSPALVAGRTARAVKGNLTARQAVDQLLAGSGLAAVQEAGGLVIKAMPPASTAGDAATLPDVTVRAQAERADGLPAPYAGGQVARGGQVGMLGNKDVMDTPFSVTNYTNQTIQDQQAQTVQDVLANEPSIINASNRSGGDFAYFRGFVSQGGAISRSLNGLSGMAPPLYPSMDYVDRVEVQRGPGALLKGFSTSGQSNQGGSVNLVTKKADDEPLTQLTTRYESDSVFGAHVDVGRRFGTDNAFGIRFNGSLDGGDTALDNQRSRSRVGALNLDYRGERVRLSADFVYQRAKDTVPFNHIVLGSRPGVGQRLSSVPSAPRASTALAPSWAYDINQVTLGMVQGEVDMTANVTAYAAFGAQRHEGKRLGEVGAPLLDTMGTIGLSNQSNRSRNDISSMQGGVRIKTETGPVAHSFSFDMARFERKYKNITLGLGSVYTSAGSLYAPAFPAFPTVGDAGDPPKVNDVVGSSIAIADSMSMLDDRIQFIIGARHQKIESRNFNTTTGAQTSSYDKAKWTPSLALVVKPWSSNVSLYANYIEDLVPGTTVGDTYANSGQVFAPYATKQYEVGAKVDWGTVTTTLAAFQISQPSTIANPSTSGGRPTLALDGEQRNRGIELNAYGELARGVRLLGGLTYLDAILTKTANGTYDGARAAGAPRFRAVIGGEWDTPFIQGMTLTGRLTYTGDAVAGNNVPHLIVPSWTQIDLGARYTVAGPWNRKPITFRFNVDNVFNKSYWVVGHPTLGSLYLSSPRTFRLSATMNF
ncbi:TonB-dependent siderophore receptor [Pseudorhodoferax sp.]|uniref:TonB-dependent siderophore receptor n=1 Tax=Pseudorhodoferax sp. TaxID=1993553 RepID=UPI0039E2CDF0